MILFVVAECIWKSGDDAGRTGNIVHEGREEIVEETPLCVARLWVVLLEQGKLKGD